jgi:hypothetical protein
LSRKLIPDFVLPSDSSRYELNLGCLKHSGAAVVPQLTKWFSFSQKRSGLLSLSALSNEWVISDTENIKNTYILRTPLINMAEVISL